MRPNDEILDDGVIALEVEPLPDNEIKPEDETPQQTTYRLAQLSPIEYELIRETEAKRLKFRTSALDKIIGDLRKEADTNNDDVVTSDEPYQGLVNGDVLLNEIAALINKHMVLPKGASPAVTLWIAATYVYDAFRVFPKLAVISPEKRCGKSTLLDILAGLCNRSLIASNITPSAIFRSVDLWQPCLIIDEADTFMAGRNDDLIGIINSGHTKTTAFVIRTVGDEHTPKKFSTWSPMAFASIKGITDTVMDRSIIVKLRRRTADEKVQRLTVDLKNDNALIRQKLAKWHDDNFHKLKANPIEPPEIPNDRAIDNWLPLFSVAHVIGGHWPERVEASYYTLNAIEEEETAAIMLLRDIKEIFQDNLKTRMLSNDLVYELVKLEERLWCEWKKGKPLTQNSLAKILRTFGIHSNTIRTTTGRAKGYSLDQFKDAFKRYLPEIVTSKRDTVTNQAEQGIQPISKRDKKENVTLSEPPQDTGDVGCHGVTLQNTTFREEV